MNWRVATGSRHVKTGVSAVSVFASEAIGMFGDVAFWQRVRKAIVSLPGSMFRNGNDCPAPKASLRATLSREVITSEHVC